MGKRKNTGRRNRRSNQFNRAPGQGIDSHYSEYFNDWGVPLVPAGINGLVVVTFSFNVNGFAYTISNNGTVVSESPTPSIYNQTLYAEDSGMFARFAQIYAQYRVHSLSLELEPPASGSIMSNLATVSLIDEADVLGVRGQVYTDLVSDLGVYKTGTLHSPQQKLRQHLNFTKWIGQTQSTAWLQTRDPAITTQDIRQVYDAEKTLPLQANVVKKLPSIFVGYVLNVNNNTNGFAAGLFKIRSRISFRQRNLVPFGVTPSLKSEPREEEDKRAELSESTKFKVDRLFEVIQQKQPPALM